MNGDRRVDSVIQRRKIQISHELENKSYGQLAKELGISKGALWKFANTDYIPTSKEILRKLELPEPTLIFQKRNKMGRYESF